ncbi:YraN family protein [Nocardioides turkmenicus]|uniref:YraN family protein n=1 Tax=Nocardioides turkmenicus TaxID=2711220 RepID=UPI0030B9CD73
MGTKVSHGGFLRLPRFPFRNWRCDDGEIDLVLRDGDTLVVCEVKTRSHDGCGTPHEAVDKTKLDRLKRLAIAWLQQHDARAPGIRIDLVAVMHAPRGSALVEHVRGL